MLRRLTRGPYDDFSPRFLPNGQIVFCSTRRGQAVQCNRQTAMASLAHAALPESYVRCGGGPERPCAVYTLHAMDSDGRDLRPISAFEMFEWTPSVDHEGRILYARWDYVDRHWGTAHHLWECYPDGRDPRNLHGNYPLPQSAMTADALKSRLGIDFGGTTPDGKFSLDHVECLGACGTAPVFSFIASSCRMRRMCSADDSVPRMWPVPWQRGQGL